MDNFEDAIKMYLAHLNSIIETYNNAEDDYGTVSNQDSIRIITRARSLVHQIVEKDSPYVQEVDSWAESPATSSSFNATIIVGILMGLRDELTVGALNSVPELIRGELFENFLEMAEYLSDEGYKDPAAVIAGSSLEVHLRCLAKKYGIEIEIIVSGSTPRYKKAETLNQELYKAIVYSPFDQKQITAWLDLRNNAAHGNYSNYSSNQVAQFIEWVKDFISKNSA